jgi:hypothetical protein
MAPVIVHVVGDNTALYTVLGTVGGVVVGAGASWLQQRSKIGADKAQLDERLAAEQTRLERELAEARNQAELAALRQVLDEGAEALTKWRLRTDNVRNCWVLNVPADHPWMEKAQADREEATVLARSVLGRLGLRLPEDDVVIGSYREAIKALDALGGFLTDNAEPGNYPQHVQESRRLFSELDDRLAAFLATAQARYGAKV